MPSTYQRPVRGGLLLTDPIVNNLVTAVPPELDRISSNSALRRLPGGSGPPMATARQGAANGGWRSAIALHGALGWALGWASCASGVEQRPPQLGLAGVHRWAVQLQDVDEPFAVNRLEAAGFTLKKARQSYESMSPPCKHLERSLLEQKLRTGGNPVLAWQDLTPGTIEIYARAFDGVQWQQLGWTGGSGGISASPIRALWSKAAMDSQGRIVVVWRDGFVIGAGGDPEDVYLRRLEDGVWVELDGSASRVLGRPARRL